jgi:hypothetical protein
MTRTYGLVATSNMHPLKLPLMTRDNAESCREKLAAMGQAVLVVNFKAE